MKQTDIVSNTTQVDTNFPKSIQQIIHQIESESQMTVGRIKKIVKEANVQAEDLLPWANFDHPSTDGYGRKVLYDGGFFDMMVMSWNPGDFSAIHDHGYSMWGAVQAFGPAEHAVFLVQDGDIRTLSRNIMRSGQIIGVGNQLVHQMGNSGDQPYLSLHIYGNHDRTEMVTADARLFDLNDDHIHRIDGGVFFALPEKQVKRREEGPKADYITLLRNTVECIRQIQKAQSEIPNYAEDKLAPLVKTLFDTTCWDELICDVKENINENRHNINSVFWKILHWELKEAGKLQREIIDKNKTDDSFQNYAEVYDEIIGKPCRDGFIANYLKFVKETYEIDFTQKALLSIGCGTGLMEEFMISKLGLNPDKLLGIDISEAMIEVAATRINAEVGDALKLDPAVQMWDLTFCGLNVFQYVDHRFLENAIRQAARITKTGGYFIGDFITPDHIRWYPHAITSSCERIVSIRQPILIEKDNHMYQRSSIININRLHDELRISYEGAHERFLPPMSRVRDYFQKAFQGQVDLYDAISLKPIRENEDTCPSTRYLVVAQKA